MLLIEKLGILAFLAFFSRGVTPLLPLFFLLRSPQPPVFCSSCFSSSFSTASALMAPSGSSCGSVSLGCSRYQCHIVCGPHTKSAWHMGVNKMLYRCHHGICAGSRCCTDLNMPYVRLLDEKHGISTAPHSCAVLQLTFLAPQKSVPA